MEAADSDGSLGQAVKGRKMMGEKMTLRELLGLVGHVKLERAPGKNKLKEMGRSATQAQRSL